MYFAKTKGFRKKISMELVYQYMEIFCNFSPTSNHLHPLRVENCGSNSRLVVDEDDYGKFRIERVDVFLFTSVCLKLSVCWILFVAVTLLTSGRVWTPYKESAPHQNQINRGLFWQQYSSSSCMVRNTHTDCLHLLHFNLYHADHDYCRFLICFIS